MRSDALEARKIWITFRPLILGLVAGLLVLGHARPTLASPEISQRVREQMSQAGWARVIVELHLPAGAHISEGNLPSQAAVAAQRLGIASARSQVLSRLATTPHRVARPFETLPFLALEVGPAALQELQAAVFHVRRVFEDELLPFFLAESVPLVGGDQAWAVGDDGTGTVIAVIDTGVDRNHPFLAGKVVDEACYSFNGTCPNGQTSQIGPGAGVACTFDLFQCFHGTHVAGIAAGNGAGAGVLFSGVAKGANLMAVQVFSRIDDALTCALFGLPSPCALTTTSDVMAGLERVYEVRGQHNFAAVNLSLGGAPSSTPCDSNPMKAPIDNLRSVEIATVAASGNSGSTDSISAPACISSAVSVGSTTKGDTISSFSDVAPFLSLLAPGEEILSSVPGGDFAVSSGTSMAAPHVSGAWAVLKQATPGATVSAILDALQQTGLQVTDTRSGGSVTKPRIRIFQALNTDNPVPTITGLSPASLPAGSAAFTLTVTGTGFVGASVVRLEGQDRPTTFVSATTLNAAIPAGDVALLGPRIITVFNPLPGGGTSNGMTLNVTPPPPAPSITSLTPSSVRAWGPAFTLTVTGGDFVSSSVVQMNGANRPTTYVSGTSLRASIPASDIATTASSLNVTVFTPAPGGGTSNAVPLTLLQPSLTVSVTKVQAGQQVTVTLTDGLGGSSDWLALAPTSAPNTSYLQWTYVGAGVTNRTWTVAMPTTPGTYEFRLFLNNGYTRAATSPTVTVEAPPPPTLTVSATTVVPGAQVTATLTNAPGGSLDWLGLASTSAPNTSYLQWTYVGANRTWTVTMPATPGTYEFRLFLNNGYTRVATSPTVTVSGNPVPTITSLSPTTAIAGGPTFTLTVTGANFVSGSVVRVNAADRTTTFVSSTQLQAAIPASDIAAAGTLSITVFTPAPGGGTSNTLTLTVGASAATLTVSATTVAPGAQVTATLTNAPGGSADWLALAPTSAPNTSYLQWSYVGAGVTNRTWTVAMPTTPGTYEFRLFLNNGYTRAATSPTVTVEAPPPPTLTVSATTVAPGVQVTATLTNAPGGSLDWLGLAPTSAPNTSYLQWTYVGAGVTNRTWTVTMPTTPGTYEFRLLLNNGYTRVATSPTVTVGN